jgi:hypothetical protein
LNRFGRRIIQMAAASPRPSWLQDPTNALGISVDLDALRGRLQAMSDAELAAFGKQMRELVYPLTYDGDGKPSVSAFSIQLDEARAEWRRRAAR